MNEMHPMGDRQQGQKSSRGKGNYKPKGRMLDPSALAEVQGLLGECEAFHNGKGARCRAPHRLRTHGLSQILHGVADDVPVLFWFKIIGLIGPIFVWPPNVSCAHAV